VTFRTEWEEVPPPDPTRFVQLRAVTFVRGGPAVSVRDANVADLAKALDVPERDLAELSEAGGLDTLYRRWRLKLESANSARASEGQEVWGARCGSCQAELLISEPKLK
jgi:hypothetical protein